MTDTVINTNEPVINIPAKSYVSAFTIRLGAAATIGKLMSLRMTSKDKETSFKLCTETGEDVEQWYLDSAGEKYKLEDLSRKTKDEGRVVDTNALKEARKSTNPQNVGNFTPHPRSTVEDYIFESAHQVYVFIPNEKDPANVQWADFITAIIKESPEISFLTVANVRGTDGLYELGVHKGNLILVRQCWPEEMYTYEDHTPMCAPEVVKKGLALVRSMMVDFDPSNYQSALPARLAEVASADYDPSVKKTQTQVTEIDLLAALDTFALSQE
jgi:hypothetical protein